MLEQFEQLVIYTLKIFPLMVVGFFTLLFAVDKISEVFEKVFRRFGFEFSFMRKRREHEELLVKTVEDVKLIKEQREEDVKQSIKHDNAIEKDLQKLTQMFIDKEIDDMRWEILDFASAISAGRRYSKEQFDHVISIYEKYEKILEEHNLTNGQVTKSMEVIYEIYKEKLKTGF